LAVAAITASAGAAIVPFSFPIDIDQAVPAPTIEPGAPEPYGTGFVELDTETNMIEWTIEYFDLSGPIVAPGAHFHGPADYGATAGIQVFLSDGDPPDPATGVLMGSATISDDQEMQLLDGLWYVNIHTEVNPPGEIRGQVVPEPSAALLLIGGLALAIRRR
jgi:hypothetical protein